MERDPGPSARKKRRISYQDSSDVLGEQLHMPMVQSSPPLDSISVLPREPEIAPQYMGGLAGAAMLSTTDGQLTTLGIDKIGQRDLRGPADSIAGCEVPRRAQVLDAISGARTDGGMEESVHKQRDQLDTPHLRKAVRSLPSDVFDIGLKLFWQGKTTTTQTLSCNDSSVISGADRLSNMPKRNTDNARVVEDTSHVTTPATSPSASAIQRIKPPKRPDIAERKPPGRVTAKRSVKKKNELIPPAEYAGRLVRGEIKVKTSAIPFLKGKRIYYHGTDLNYASKETKAKMGIVSVSPHACTGTPIHLI